VLPGSGWLALEPGELSASGARRGPDRPGPTMGRGYAVGREARWRATAQ